MHPIQTAINWHAGRATAARERYYTLQADARKALEAKDWAGWLRADVRSSNTLQVWELHEAAIKQHMDMKETLMRLGKWGEST